MRLWVDDQLVINGWKVQSQTDYISETFLTGGDHVLRIEYFEATAGAMFSFAVDPVQFHFDLFDSPDLTGPIATSFTDTMTNLEWRHAPPVGKSGIFSLRASGTKKFRGGVYRFHARHTGGCRIWVDSTLVLNDWLGSARAAVAT